MRPPWLYVTACLQEQGGPLLLRSPSAPALAQEEARRWSTGGQPHDADPLTLDPAGVDPVHVPEPEEPEGFDAEYQQVLATAREIVQLEELLIIDSRDEDAWVRLRHLRRG